MKAILPKTPMPWPPGTKDTQKWTHTRHTPDAQLPLFQSTGSFFPSRTSTLDFLPPQLRSSYAWIDWVVKNPGHIPKRQVEGSLGMWGFWFQPWKGRPYNVGNDQNICSLAVDIIINKSLAHAPLIPFLSLHMPGALLTDSQHLPLFVSELLLKYPHSYILWSQCCVSLRMHTLKS